MSSVGEQQRVVPVPRRLLEGFEVERAAPANLVPEDDVLFRHEYRRAFGPTDLHVVGPVHVTSDGSCIRGLQVVRELEFLPGEVQPSLRYILGSLRRRRRLAGGEPYVVAFNCWSGGNYFHWMCDVMPRLFLVRDLLPHSTVLLPSSHDVPFVHKTLGAFRPGAVEFFDPGVTPFLREAVVPGHIATSGNYHEATMRELAAFLRAELAPGATPSGRRVYITRRKAKFRYVLNEDEVAGVVREHGFEVVSNEDITLEEQVALHTEAAALVGIMGANLVNTMFMPEGSSLLQLSKRDDAHNHCYYALAAAAGVRFLYQHCDYVDTRPGDYWNITVDIPELQRNLQLLTGPAA